MKSSIAVWSLGIYGRVFKHLHTLVLNGASLVYISIPSFFLEGEIPLPIVRKLWKGCDELRGYRWLSVRSTEVYDDLKPRVYDGAIALKDGCGGFGISCRGDLWGACDDSGLRGE